MSQACNNCNTAIKPGEQFCTSCGAEAQTGAAPDWKNATPGLAAGAVPEIFETGTPGFSVFFRQYLKNPRQLMPILVLALLWLILSLLPALGINPLPVKILSFLTFAQGGMYVGIWGAVGGIVGKAVFAYFVSALIMPLFSDKNPFKGMRLKSLASGLALQGASAAAELVIGAGLALVVFNFFTGNAGPVNSMIGITGLLLALKALLSKGDFLRGLLLSAANKLSRGKTPSPVSVNRVLAGYGAGSALGVLLTALPLPYLPYILGAIFFIAGLIVSKAFRPGKKVAAT